MKTLNKINQRKKLLERYRPLTKEEYGLKKQKESLNEVLILIDKLEKDDKVIASQLKKIIIGEEVEV